MRLAFAILLLPAALAACGPSDNDAGPGGVTISEAAQLNDAAAMLDNDSVTANAVGADTETTR